MNVRKINCPPYINTDLVSLNRDVYRGLHQDRKKTIQKWFYRARKKCGCDSEDAFDRFIFAWISFNGWASCVTDEDTDTKIINCVASCPDLQCIFNKLYSSKTNFKDIVNRFTEFLPIFRTRDVYKHYYQPPSGTRKDIIQDYFKHEDIKFEPQCAKDHIERGKGIPRDWPHILCAIYQVRCNLFHGGKSPHLENDIKIVESAFDVLINFLSETELIDSNQRNPTI